jgi:hypothetical protein
VKRPIGKLIASLVLAAPLGFVGLMPASAASQIPFKGQFAGSFTFPDQMDILLAGTGTAPFLGQATSSGHIVIVGPSTCTNGFAVQDTETLTSTDEGDTITFSVTSQACPTATPGVYEIKTPYTVTSGTGQFAGATGQGTADCFGNFNNDTFHFTMQGTISHPMSS